MATSEQSTLTPEPVAPTYAQLAFLHTALMDAIRDLDSAGCGEGYAFNLPGTVRTLRRVDREFWLWRHRGKAPEGWA